MRIFVAGATGVIGSILVPKLVSKGHDVAGMTHNKGNVAQIKSMNAHRVRNKCSAQRTSHHFYMWDAANVAVSAMNWPTGKVNIVYDEPAMGKEWLPAYASMIGAPEPDIHTDKKRVNAVHRTPRLETRIDESLCSRLGKQDLFKIYRLGFTISCKTIQYYLFHQNNTGHYCWR